MQFDLVSPERRLASLEVSAVQIPGADGDLTAMPGHAPVITNLRPGILKVESPSGNMDYVKTHLEFNDKIKYYFGDQKGRKWTEEDIELTNGCKLISKSNVAGIRGGAKLHKRYDLIILDEPTFGLGYQQKRKLSELLKNILVNKHLILISHDIDFVNAHCDQVLNFDLKNIYKNHIIVNAK